MVTALHRGGPRRHLSLGRELFSNAEYTALGTHGIAACHTAVAAQTTPDSSQLQSTQIAIFHCADGAMRLHRFLLLCCAVHLNQKICSCRILGRVNIAQAEHRFLATAERCAPAQH